jgi:hypothetical protein
VLVRPLVSTKACVPDTVHSPKSYNPTRKAEDSNPNRFPRRVAFQTTCRPCDIHLPIPNKTKYLWQDSNLQPTRSKRVTLSKLSYRGIFLTILDGGQRSRTPDRLFGLSRLFSRQCASPTHVPSNLIFSKQYFWQDLNPQLTRS